MGNQSTILNKFHNYDHSNPDKWMDYAHALNIISALIIASQSCHQALDLDMRKCPC